MSVWVRLVGEWLPIEMLVRLLIAIAAGAVIGWDRERLDKPAGLRTHMLVSLGAAAFMIGAIEFAAQAGSEYPGIRFDPMRALSGIIGGIGFLGAGTIIRAGGSVEGVTTAASIWICAAVGTAAGMGLYQLALICGILALLVLWGIGLLEHRVIRTKGAGKDL